MMFTRKQGSFPDRFGLQAFRGIFLLFFLLYCLAFLNPSRIEAASLPAFLQQRKVVHACGEIGGYNYTNSLEALEQSLENRVRCVEIDFTYTSDNALVCVHGWKAYDGKVLSKKEFLQSKTAGGFTTMTAKKALKLLTEYNYTWLVVDVKGNTPIQVYRDIVDICKENGYTKYLRKIVPQFYKEGQFQKIRKVYPFRYYIYSLYKQQTSTAEDYERVGKFCKANGIQVVCVPHTRVNSEMLDILHSYGVIVAVQTINKQSIYESMKEMGVDVIYTDFL